MESENNRPDELSGTGLLHVCDETKRWRPALRILTFAFALLFFGSIARASEGQITIAGTQRTYVLLGEKPGSPRPLIVALHGNMGTGAQYARYGQWGELAKRQGIAVVLPDGLNRAWADGRPAGQFRGRDPIAGTDDVGFLSALIARLISQGIATPNRIYIAGASNGGNMSFRMLCERADLFAGAAIVITVMAEAIAKECRPSRPVPLLMINGSDDRFALVKASPGTSLGLEGTLAFWARHNGCAGVRARRSLPDRDPQDRSTVIATDYACPSHGEIISYLVQGGGHQSPSIAGQAILEGVLGRRNRDIEAADEIWEFFRRH